MFGAIGFGAETKTEYNTIRYLFDVSHGSVPDTGATQFTTAAIGTVVHVTPAGTQIFTTTSAPGVAMNDRAALQNITYVCLRGEACQVCFPPQPTVITYHRVEQGEVFVLPNEAVVQGPKTYVPCAGAACEVCKAEKEARKRH